MKIKLLQGLSRSDVRVTSNLLLITFDTFLFKFCKVTKSHLLDFLFCLFGFSLSFLFLISLNYLLYFMDELCLWIGFFVDDVAHVGCYCLISD